LNTTWNTSCHKLEQATLSFSNSVSNFCSAIFCILLHCTC